MGRLLRLLLLLVLALPCGARTATAAPTAPPAAAPGQLLEQGLELYRTGHADAALPVLRGLIVRYPEAPAITPASLTLARIFLAQGQPDQARLYLERLPQTSRGAEAQLLLGRALIASGEQEIGLEQLHRIDPVQLDAADRGERLRAMATASADLGRRLPALTFLHRALPLLPEQRTALLATGYRLLGQLPADELAEAAFMYRGTALGAEALLVQAEVAERKGDLATAQQLASTLLETDRAFPRRKDAVLLYQRLTGRTFLRRAIGVLLPQSGRYATFGALVRRGMELARQQQSGPAPVRFIYRDSAADPEASAAAVDALLYQEGVMAIAGPITGNAARAAAVRAQREGVPLLTLAQRQGLPQIGDQIFRDSLTPQQQAAAVARYAVERQGLRRFAVLYPQNRLGRELTELFAAAVEDLGGVVTARASYPEQATDFRRQVRLLLGEDPDVEQEEPLPPAGPTVDFQALFIPDYADRIALIAPQLPFYGLEGLPLLGINGWNSPELARLAGGYLQGAVFVDGFFATSSRPAVQNFVAAYQAAYGEEPSILEAQGYEVATILLQALKTPGVDDRAGLRQALLRLQNVSGVTGTTGFDAQGEALKKLFLLQVRSGQIVEIAPPPAAAN